MKDIVKILTMKNRIWIELLCAIVGVEPNVVVY